jgi:CHAD domain-containing protein
MALDTKRIQKPARKLRKLLKQMPRRPAPEQIHGFRTNAKRLETILGAFALDNRRGGSRLSKRVAKLRKCAGKVRDFDVLTDYASRIDYGTSERECSVRLLEHLGAQREKRVRNFHDLQKLYFSSLRKELKRTANKIADIFPPKGDGRRKGKLISATVAASVLTLLSELKEPSQLRKSNLHAYRLKVKELRNLLQLAKNADQQVFVDRLGEVKDAIGEWHDWEVLVATANETLAHGQNCRLVNKLRETTALKYEKAFRLSQGLRRQWLRMNRHGKDSSQFLGPAEGVWSATASLVA